MSSETPVFFESVWKSYERFAASRLHHRLAFWLGGRRREHFWALQDVSFTVPRGSVFGVIGGNGSGKSTLLKLLAGISRPDRGRAEVAGRVGCLIEVSAGFDLEMTGRENIYLSGSLHGMCRAEIDDVFDSIVDFSGDEVFIDTPVKRYSTGMLMRLGFAVAVHTRPDVLLVDEVLAVGDAAFQRKCLDHIREFRRKGGTVVLVTHNIRQVRDFCDRVLWLEAGRAVEIGAPEEVASRYAQAAETALRTSIGAQSSA